MFDIFSLVRDLSSETAKEVRLLVLQKRSTDPPPFVSKSFDAFAQFSRAYPLSAWR